MIMIANIINSALPSNQVSVVTKDNSINSAIIDGPTNSLFNLIRVTNSMIGTSAVTNPSIAPDAIESSKIKNGQIGLADLASNSVDGSKIVDGSVAKTDVSTSFIKKVTLSSGMQGWDVGSYSKDFGIEDSQVTETSIVQINVRDLYIDPPPPHLTFWFSMQCSVRLMYIGGFSVTCDLPPSNNAKLNYVVVS